MRRDLLIIAISMFTWGVGESMFFFFQPLYLEQLGASHVSIGGILGALGVAMTVSHLPAGYLADRFGRRPLLWAAWFNGFTATIIMALATSLPIFVVGLLWYGLTSFVIAPLNSYITAARGNLSVPRVLTLVSAVYNSGAIIGPRLGGYVADQFGLRWLYPFASGIFLVSFLLILFIRRQQIDHPEPGQGKNGLHLTPRYASYLGIVFLAILATYLPQPLSSNYLQNEQGLVYGQIGELGSISSLGVVVLSLILGQLNARWGFLLGQASVAAFTLFLWRGSGMPWFLLGYFLLGGYRTMRSMAVAQTRELVPASQMGLAYGLTETVSAVALILAPPLAGILYEGAPQNVYMVSLLLIAFSIVASLGYTLSTRKRPELREEST